VSLFFLLIPILILDGGVMLLGVKYPEHVTIPNLFLVGKSYGLVVPRPPFVVSSPEHLCNLSASLTALPIDEPWVRRLKQAMKPFSRFILLDTHCNPAVVLVLMRPLAVDHFT
jgi:hypothetical protein